MKQKESLGEQVRKIAEQLQKEKTLQIKSTSRILEAAAQISENHDRLIDEVTNMIEQDLTQASQKETYTVEMLQNRFRTLTEAKAHLNLKAKSWEILVKKLNHLATQSVLAVDNSNTSILKRLNSMEEEIKGMRTEISQILLILTQSHD